MKDKITLNKFLGLDEKPTDTNGIYISNIVVEAETESVVITLISDKLLNRTAIDNIQKKICKKFELKQVVIKCLYPEGIEAENILIEYPQCIMNYFKDKYPSVHNMLQDCSLSGNKNTIIVDMSGSNAACCLFMKMKDVGMLIKECFENLFDISPAVKIIWPNNNNDNEHIQLFEDLKKEIVENEGQIPLPDIKPVEDKKKPQPKNNGQNYKNGTGKNKTDEGMILGRKFTGSKDPIDSITPVTGDCIVRGIIISYECILMKNGDKCIIKFAVTDYSDSIICKFFAKIDDREYFQECLKPGEAVEVRGNAVYDSYDRDLCINVVSIAPGEKEIEKEDTSKVKRVELHAHTKMSSMDSVCDTQELVNTAIRFGHKAVAITDHGVVQAFPDAMNAKESSKSDIKIIYGVEAYINENMHDLSNGKSYHCVILVKNKTGLKNLYKLVSLSHLDWFYKRPQIPKEVLIKYREGLILGSACEAGELYQAILENKHEDELKHIADFYDYLEVQPTGNNIFMVRNDMLSSVKDIENINVRIINLAKELGKPVVATCDVHFITERDSVFRKLLMAGQGYNDAENQAPLYFRTTEEMLKEFEYLGDETAYEIVVTNTNMIADMIQDIRPIPKGTYTPEIEGAEQELETSCMDKAKEIYGDPLPDLVEKRLVRELKAIIGNGFAVMYIIARKLVLKSVEDGYIVGSRGSVGSSFAAHMCGITEVNALPAHYICRKCKHSEFILNGECDCGFDLPDKNCTVCGEKYAKDGFDIPFETFLGFNGDKAPDIDLNFAGEYQANAHKYTEELFGEGYTFRAGTIGTLAEKTAMGFVKGYFDDKGLTVKKAEMNRLTEGCTGVKRTTGQHPGGIVVVPKNYEIYDFCPVQHPADAKDSDIITTHFDFHSIHDTILKLDILGHDDPTTIKMLEDLTGIKASEIPLHDDKVLSLFTSTKNINVNPEDIDSQTGTLGLPETGTEFVRGVLMDTKPTMVSDLIRIMGLTHGTDVWLNNAQVLVSENNYKLNDVICNRDDIMNYLIKQGLESFDAFDIMEKVRKGKGLSEKQENIMREKKVPEWYIQSCKKIKYMFPKAHAAAYAMMALRIGWYKVYRPVEFYTAFFSIRGTEFDSMIMTKGKDKAKAVYRELKNKNVNDMTQKEKGTLNLMMIVIEMYERGIEILPVDLYKSEAVRFKIEDNKIRPSLNSLSGLGDNAAYSIVEARSKGLFKSIEDLRITAKIGKQIIEILKNYGCFEGMPETSQMTIF